MELRQLEYLMAVVEEGSFTRAAARVHISQSGVSAQIRLLERELGQTLLDRAARTVRPTAAGLAIMPSVREALAGVESDVVSDEQLVVAIPAGHPVAERRRIGLEELMDYPLITLPPGAGVR